MIKAKFKCDHVDLKDENEYITLNVVTDDGGECNRQWSKFTPSGSLDLVISNEKAHGKFEVGKCYYVYIEETEQ